MATAPSTHIVIDDSGVAWIDDTNIKVIEVVLDRQANGWSPEEIHFQQPHLSLAQIHAALSFYYDHKDEIDTQIEQRLEQASRAQADARVDSPARARLKSAGKIS
ncbi:MAG: DUF433 domain-containing protein [Pirellulales bacterium]|nr:DUF433 domain-containing protein [Pirellulales bacterium]